ncbi:MAG: hypothetical protein C4523_18840 [Myxococcales bacterium]|nr:MAG: hypothetical protein C4523_18840 [Myxococcales bacterium]
MERMVVLMSGGLNGVVAASRMLANVELHFLHVDYGQAAAKSERLAVARISTALAGKLHVADLPRFDRNGMPGPGGAVDAKRPTSNERVLETRPSGVMLAILALAQQLAAQVGAEDIVCGASEACSRSDAEAGFCSPAADGRRAFFHACSIALEMGSPSAKRMSLELPFIDVSREDIIRTGLRLGAPLPMTWSCHAGGEAPCGSCAGCRSRAAAFEMLGLDDPALAAATR